MNFMLGTFLTWGETETTSMLTHAKNMITDLSPLLLIILGVGLAVIIISAIVGAIKK